MWILFILTSKEFIDVSNGIYVTEEKRESAETP